MKHLNATAALLAAFVVSSSAAAQEAERTAAAAVQTMLTRSSVAALKGRYTCIYVRSARAERSDATNGVRVIIDGFAELPGSHAIVPLPANWDVHLEGLSRATRIDIAEAALADALIAARTAAERDALLDAHPDADRDELARQLSDKGFAIDVTGDYARAEAIAELALAVAHDGGSDDAAARAIWLRGRARDGQDRIDEALLDYTSALHLAESGGDEETAAASLTGIGTLTMIKGDDAGGMSAVSSGLERALAIGNDRIAATALLILGNRQQHAGDLASALRHYDDASTHAERAGDLLINAAALANTGLVYNRLNDYELSALYLQQAIVLYRKTGNILGVIRNLRNLAEVSTEAGDTERAEATLRQIDKLLPGHPDVRIAAYRDVTRAKMALRQRHFGLAERLALLALQASRDAGDERLTAFAAQTLGNSYARRHRNLEALPLYHEAVRLAKSLNDGEVYWRARADEGYALGRLGRTAEAKAAYLDAIETVEGISATMPGGSPDQRSFFQDKRILYHEMFWLVAPADPSEALAWEERARSRALLAFLSLGRTVPDSELTEHERGEQSLIEHRLRDVNEKLLRARGEPGLDRRHVAELTGAVKRARVERDALTSRLFRDHSGPALARNDPPLPNVDELRRNIPADGVIIEYAVVGEHIWVIAVSRDHPPRILAIHTDEATLNRKVSRFVELLAGSAPALPALSHELYNLLLKPVASSFRGGKTICLIPNSSLWQLPFQALLDDDGRYLIERHPLFYAPSAAVLTWYASHPSDAAPRAMLAIGNPSLGRTTASASTGGVTLSPLPGAEREARTIASIYGSTSQLLTGAAATEWRFKALAPQFRMIHLATHGSFDNLQPMYSHVVLAPGGSEDGLFEAREWIGLGIHADLVVLSGCKTGRGRDVSGEGVLGMSWALLAAGCPAAVVAQTDVLDSTAELMIAFHRRLANSRRSGPGRAFDPRAATDALREAQLSMLRDKRYAEPIHWAGFVLIGRGW